jgi:hypothetical protein
MKHTTYFDVYDELFFSYRNKKITFVEIGVYGGGSLFMWRNFFGPKARIIGIDLNPIAKKWEKFGFEIFIGNQSSHSFWNKVKKKIGKIDIVLDDGGHTYEQQIITAVSLLENIKDNGMLVVEDTHTSYMEGFGPVEYSFINYVKELIDKINHRFSLLNQKYSDNGIWSVEIFESIVAFKVNNKALQTISQKIENSKKIDGALQDFRYVDKTKVDILKYFKNFQINIFNKRTICSIITVSRIENFKGEKQKNYNYIRV